MLTRLVSLFPVVFFFKLAFNASVYQPVETFENDNSSLPPSIIVPNQQVSALTVLLNSPPGTPSSTAMTSPAQSSFCSQRAVPSSGARNNLLDRYFLMQRRPSEAIPIDGAQQSQLVEEEATQSFSPSSMRKAKSPIYRKDFAVAFLAKPESTTAPPTEEEYQSSKSDSDCDFDANGDDEYGAIFKMDDDENQEEKN